VGFINRFPLLVSLFFLLVLVPVNAEGSPDRSLPDGLTPQWEKVDSGLQQTLSELGEEAPVDFILRLTDEADLSGVEFQRHEVVGRLRAVTTLSQARLMPLLEEMGFQIKTSFWITNALLLQGPAGRVPILTTSPLVARLHSNFRVELTGKDLASSDSVQAAALTWGLERVGADQVWSEFGVRGAGVRVCVSDTGVDVDHPDLAGRMWSDVPGDPQYPGGWIEFSSGGIPVGGSTPHDTHGHGTHTSGTVLGGNASGTDIGMAPEATLMHALVLPGGGGSFAQVTAGIEWCVSPYDADGNPAGQPADVHSMSWGASAFVDELVDPIRNSYLAGTIPVAAAGNCGEGCTDSPGNIYDTLGIGASDEGDLIASFSGGEVVSKASWSSPPADWPDQWVVPLLSAPGVNVYSSLPGGTYGSWEGTSMATPHVAGCAALMLAANPDLHPDDIRLALVDTAVWYDTYAPAPPDVRYGWGRMDCHAATTSVAFNGGIQGSVRDLEDGALLPEAQLNASGAGISRLVQSDDRGEYRISLPPGMYNLTVARFGYLPQTVTGVMVSPETWVNREFLLSPSPRSNITGTATSSASGIAIPDVMVEITGIPVTVRANTSENGAFVLTKVPEGTYDLLATSPYFQDTPVLGVPVIGGTDSIVNFAMDPLPGAQVVDYQLEVTPETGLWSETFQATIQAKNVDSSSGDYTASLYVNGSFEGAQTVTLASGEVRSVTFPVSRDPVGVYVVTVGPHDSSFRVRPPILEIQVQTLNSTSLPDAWVTVGLDDSLLDMGRTDGNGSVTFDSPGGSHGQFWVVAQALDVLPEGYHYFLTRELLVEDDLAVVFQPAADGTGTFDLSMATVVAGQNGNVHLRRSEMPVALSQAYIFPRGSLIVYPASYSLWSEVTWTSPGSTWTYETSNVTKGVTSGASTSYKLGGRLEAWMEWTQTGENATAFWNISDSYGNDLLSVVQARAGILEAGETTFHDPVLSFWSAAGELLASGYVAWSQKPAQATIPANTSVALVQVDLESGNYPFDHTFTLEVSVLDEEGTPLPYVGTTRTTTVQAVGTALLSGTPIPVNLTINDEPVAVQPNGSFSHGVNLTNGLNTLVIQAVDPAGNVREEVYVLDVLESKTDVALVVAPLPDYVNQTSVEVSGMVELGARLTINEVEVQAETDGSFRVTWDLVEGSNTIAVAAEDYVGNRREVVYQVVRDTLPPDLVLLAPTSGQTTRNATVSFVGTTDPNATLTINGLAVPLEEGTFVYEVGLETGNNTFVLVARDPAGNVNQTLVRVYRESAPLAIPLDYVAYLLPIALVAAIALAFRRHRRRLRWRQAWYRAKAQEAAPQVSPEPVQEEEEVPWLHR
jgi:hypothetical protein